MKASAFSVGESVKVSASSVGESVEVSVTSVNKSLEVSSLATTVEQYLEMKGLKLATWNEMSKDQ